MGLSLGLSLLGTGTSIIGGLMGGDAAEDAAEYNAMLAERNAVLALRRAAEEERRFRVTSTKNLGAMRAAYAAAGVTMEGSPSDALADSLYIAEMDAQTIRQGGEAEAQAYRDQANLERMYGAAQKKASRISAVSTLISGGAKAYSIYSDLNP